MKADKLQIEVYKAILKVDPDIYAISFEGKHPKIGDIVNPGQYYSNHFVYKLNRHPYNCKLTKEEVESSYWVCSGWRQSNWNTYVTFKSVDKINGRKRSMTFENPRNMEVEIVDMPEREKLIIDYQDGKYTLLEILKLFKEKKYNSLIEIKSISLRIDGDDYLQAVEEMMIEKQNKEKICGPN